MSFSLLLPLERVMNQDNSFSKLILQGRDIEPRQIQLGVILKKPKFIQAINNVNSTN